jgi:endonuclease YncB( thermonuclease family)
MDDYGRITGTVYLEDINVNVAIVCAGHGWWYKKYALMNWEFRNCEHEARKQKLGLWADPDPIPPWEFRRGRRS